MEHCRKQREPDAIHHIMGLLSDLHRLKMDNNRNSLLVYSLNSIIDKVSLILEIYQYEPRIPWHDIEQVLVDLCTEDNSLHGVLIRINFLSKRGRVDNPKLGLITLNT